jgi:GDP/UDP-N,N'-diacetylbacillosamine 2-epimerase (hydrolysing)
LSRRRVCYVSGTRADFGLMARTLSLLNASSGIELGIAVAGMHLSPKYGSTVREIEAAGLPIKARIATDVEETSGSAMARAIAETLAGLVSMMSGWKPDVMLLLGDRGEMLAGAIAGLHCGTAVAHVHGGERSGTVDEPVRHAISKLSHYHFVATPGARERLVSMGERAERIFVTGAPGLDEFTSHEPEAREALCERAGLDAKRPVCLVVFHPVVQEEAQAGEQARALLEGVLAAGAQVLALRPNADAGGDRMRAVMDAYEGRSAVRVMTHLPRPQFMSWMARADAMVGNSSAGIIEAASVGQWVVNVGSRQSLRERSGNVVDVPPQVDAIQRAVVDVLRRPRGDWQNIYGDGRTAPRIAQFIERLPLDAAILDKTNAY